MDMMTARVYRSTWEQLQKMKEDPETYVNCCEALFAYAFDGKAYEGDNLIVGLFMGSQAPLCDAYRRKVERGTESGKRGGRPRKDTSYDSEAFKKKAREKIEYLPAEKTQAKPKQNPSITQAKPKHNPSKTQA